MLYEVKSDKSEQRPKKRGRKRKIDVDAVDKE